MSARAAAAWGVMALGVSVMTLAVALLDEVQLGVTVEAGGGRIEAVDPTGGAWAAGLRPGQVVDVLRPADQPGGWAIEAIDDGGLRHGFTARQAELPLRLSALGALGGLVLAALALLVARRDPRRGELLAAHGSLVGGIPFGLTAATLLPSVGLVVAAAGPFAWLARWPLAGRRAGLVLAAGGIGISAVVVGARLVLGPAVGPLAQAWAAAIAVAGLVMLALGSGMSRAVAVRAVSSLRLVDIAVLTLVAVCAIALVAVGLPAVVAVVVVGVPLLAYGRARTVIASMIDRLLLSEVREREAIRAMEEERARVSREIHDDPLQALAGVIRQLDDPAADTAAASDSLRTVAARLRTVATDLHPPVLDDLGLVPAITAGARAATTIRVEVKLANRGGYGRDARPPEEVELAVYRIVQEAIANADRHSGGRRARVQGEVGADRIELEVTDDGVGLSEAATDAALRDGHLGLPSMRRRAAAIGADLEVEALAAPAHGTRVRLRWAR